MEGAGFKQPIHVPSLFIKVTFFRGFNSFWVALTFAVVQHTQSRGGWQKPCFHPPRGGGCGGPQGWANPNLGKTCVGMVLLYNQLVTGGAAWGRRAAVGSAAGPSLRIPKISSKRFGDQWPGPPGSLGLTMAPIGPTWTPHPHALPTAPGLYLGSVLLGLSPAASPRRGQTPAAIAHWLCSHWGTQGRRLCRWGPCLATPLGSGLACEPAPLPQHLTRR